MQQAAPIDDQGTAEVLPKQSIDTGHTEMIHDVQLDYFGRRLATCSSDRSIKIFEVDAAGDRKFETELLGHDGPVWQVSWAHPKFGNIIASCGFDRRVILWIETSKKVWRKMFEYIWHASSVNSISFAPPEYGLCFACASSDGFVSVCSQKSDGSWDERRVCESVGSQNPVHPLGANSVSWAPAISPGGLWIQDNSSLAPKRIVSGGCDNFVKIWKCDDQTGEWILQGPVLEKHTDWVRGVAWAPSFGLAATTIASCGQDNLVVLWVQDDSGSEWIAKELPRFQSPVWSVSWSPAGNVLGVASGEDKVTLWKEQLDGTWSNISELLDTQQK